MGKPNRRARRNTKNSERQRLVNEPEGSNQRDKPQEPEFCSADIIDGCLSQIPAQPTKTKTNEGEKGRNTRKYVVRPFIAFWKLIVKCGRFFDRHDGAVTAFATFWLVILTGFYVHYSKRQWEAMGVANQITQTALLVSQRAYVTIGRKDGVVADFVVPKDPEQNAEMVIYFQNTGHIPAKFGWGIMAGFMSSKSSGIVFSHRWSRTFGRTLDKKQKAISETGDSTIIAGDSIYVATMGVISQKDLANLPNTSPGMFITGIYQYCDELGNQDMRQFSMTYRTGAPSSALSFTLGDDTSWLNVLSDSQKNTPNAIFPCETIREKQQQE